ncbi:hypothetical protein [Oligoflexus tunisiensis]|uniref:hypothetical protein n=1 Tax=Oligoflexus tunisiensis TaxID=708132 RepID=UPI00114CFA92|nr:hypothetical protein [Oligoflexus tunisiensis]
MTELNPQETPRGSLTATSQSSTDIPTHLRPDSSEDMIPQPLNSQGILGDQSLAAGEAETEDFDVATSVGASINESMMMPRETLAAEQSDLRQTASLSQQDDDMMASEETMWQKQVKVVDQKIRQNPYAYIAGALGLGLMLGRSMSSGRSHSV